MYETYDKCFREFRRAVGCNSKRGYLGSQAARSRPLRNRVPAIKLARVASEVQASGLSDELQTSCIDSHRQPIDTMRHDEHCPQVFWKTVSIKQVIFRFVIGSVGLCRRTEVSARTYAWYVRVNNHCSSWSGWAPRRHGTSRLMILSMQFNEECFIQANRSSCEHLSKAVHSLVGRCTR